jgi:protocatechuate 3,4-dioxygenase beta subunit
MRSRFPSFLLLSSLALSAGAAEITGKVTSERRGVVGAAVAAIAYETPFAVALREASGSHAPAPIASATTSADGRFRLSVPATAGPFTVRVTFGGLAPRTVEGLFEKADVEDVGEINLRAGDSLAGRVVDAALKPVSGAVVLVRTGRDLAPTRTTANGTFRFDDIERPTGPAALGSSSLRFSVHAPGFELQASAGRFGGAPVVVRLTASSAKFTGLIKDTAGRPVADAVVRITGDATSRWVRTDATGRFEIGGPPAKQGRIEVLGRDGSSLETAIPAASSTGATFTLVRAGTLEGRVTQADNGRLVPGVKVTARSGGWSAITKSGPDGRYRFTGLSQGTYRVRFDEKRFVLVDRANVEIGSGETKAVDVALTPAVTLVGRVTDESGRPVAGARGTLSSGNETRMGMMLRGVARDAENNAAFVSEPDGSFKATRIAPGTNQRLAVSHPDFERRLVPGIDLVAGTPKPLSVDVVLSPGVTIAGTVKDKDGQPVAGAAVAISRSVRMQGGRGGNMVSFATIEAARPQAETDFEGKFAFKGLSVGDYEVTVTKAGFTRNVSSGVKTGDGAAPLEVTLMPGAAISGRLVQPNGLPVTGYMVSAAPTAPDRPAGGPMVMMGGRGLMTPTDPDGSFTLEGLTPGSAYDLTLMGGGDFRGGQRKRNIVAPASDVEIEVAARGRITGRVVDTGTNAPVTEFEARVSPARPGGGMQIVVRAGGPSESDRRIPFSSPDGAFSFDDIAPGNWDVTVWAKTYQEARTGGVTVAPGEAKAVEVKATRGLVIRGRVVDAKGGRGIPDASVSAQESGSGGGMFIIDDGSFGPGILTDADGRFEIVGQAPGAYQITAKHPQFSEGTARLTLEDRDGALDIPLVPGGTIAGVVLSAQGAPLAGAEVSLQGGNDGGGMRFGFDGQSTLSDGAGRFRFEHLAAGRYKVGATLRTESSPTVDVPLNAGDVREDIRLALDAGAVLRGVVNGLPEGERAGLMVNAQGADGFFASVRTNADGSFEFAGVPKGTLTLRATAGDNFFGSSRTAVREVVIPEGQNEVSTEILFEDGLTITGSVMRRGAPVAGARVSAFMSGTGRQAGTRADESGAFRLVGLEAGRVNVTAFAENFESQVSQVVELKSDTTVDLVIPTAKLTGTVVDAASGLPLESTVEMQQTAPAPGTPTGRMLMTTDSSGRFAFEDLDPVDFRLTARRSGYEAVTRTVRPSDNGEELRIELKRGSGLAIEARDAQMGFGLRSVFVRVQQGAADVFTGAVSLDGEGHGEIPGLPPGSYALTAQASGYAPVRIPNVMVPAPALKLAFTPGGSVEFRTTEEYLAGGTKSGQIISMNGTPIGFGPGGPGSFRLSRLTQRLENLTPGGYRLVLDDGTTKSFEIAEGGLAVVTIP